MRSVAGKLRTRIVKATAIAGIGAALVGGPLLLKSSLKTADQRRATAELVERGLMKPNQVVPHAGEWRAVLKTENGSRLSSKIIRLPPATKNFVYGLGVKAFGKKDGRLTADELERVLTPIFAYHPRNVGETISGLHDKIAHYERANEKWRQKMAAVGSGSSTSQYARIIQINTGEIARCRRIIFVLGEFQRYVDSVQPDERRYLIELLP